MTEMTQPAGKEMSAGTAAAAVDPGCSGRVSLPTPHCTIKALWRNGYSRAKVRNVRDESGVTYHPGDEGNCQAQLEFH